jgi:polysaccharide export outer membrane protein
LKTTFIGKLFLCLALLSCVSANGQGDSESLTQTTAGLQASSPSADYKLLPSDYIQVRVFQEEDLTRETSVSQDYTISLPLIGTVDVRGRSLRQTEDLIRQLYDRDFLVNPQITLVVLRYAERAVNVIGSVNSPQAVPFPPERGLTLIEAVARAGGFSRLADKSKVRIVRTDDKGVNTTFTINVDRLIDGRSASNWPLQVDDIVEVPERFL